MRNKYTRETHTQEKERYNNTEETRETWDNINIYTQEEKRDKTQKETINIQGTSEIQGK